MPLADEQIQIENAVLLLQKLQVPQEQVERVTPLIPIDAIIFMTSLPIFAKEVHASATAKSMTSPNSNSLHQSRLPSTPPPGTYEK